MLVIRSSWFLVLPLRSHKINSSIRTENSLYAQNAHIISILNVRPRHYVELLRYWSLIVMKKKEFNENVRQKSENYVCNQSHFMFTNWNKNSNSKTTVI